MTSEYSNHIMFPGASLTRTLRAQDRRTKMACSNPAHHQPLIQRMSGRYGIYRLLHLCIGIMACIGSIATGSVREIERRIISIPFPHTHTDTHTQTPLSPGLLTSCFLGIFPNSFLLPHSARYSLVCCCPCAWSNKHPSAVTYGRCSVTGIQRGAPRLDEMGTQRDAGRMSVKLCGRRLLGSRRMPP